ncbi:hypothetical protein [Bradyrhizobium sp. I1.7.5]|uniref:hypothetical protein n=1 Tax=Bradyrhizobium sp. I1.7.5 TaxID=3156363 RepID=UPI003395E458
MSVETFLGIAALAVIWAGQYVYRLRRDLRRAAALLAYDHDNRAEWWQVRLRGAQGLLHDDELNRQRHILEEERAFRKYLRDRYGNPDDFDTKIYSTYAENP